MRFELRLLHADSEKDLWLKFNKKKTRVNFCFQYERKSADAVHTNQIWTWSKKSFGSG